MIRTAPVSNSLFLLLPLPNGEVAHVTVEEANAEEARPNREEEESAQATTALSRLDEEVARVTVCEEEANAEGTQSSTGLVGDLSNA